MTSNTTHSSYQLCKERFNSAKAASIYQTRHQNSRKNKLERRCIAKALIDVKKNSLILDIPCGTGRLSQFTKNLGFQVIGADYSEHMLQHAKQSLASSQQIEFNKQDVTATSYPDNAFEATVCNRLFHHFSTPELRQLALSELARITNGPIIISFFNSYSLSALWTSIKNFVKNKKPNDRIAIPFYTFKKDIEACGLTITKTYYTAWGRSPQTYVKLIKK